MVFISSSASVKHAYIAAGDRSKSRKTLSCDAGQSRKTVVYTKLGSIRSKGESKAAVRGIGGQNKR